jgi:signal transduction histidine kinase
VSDLDSIGTLEHVRPGAYLRWVRSGLVLGTLGYAAGFVASALMEPGRWAPRLPEIATFAVGVIALALARGRRARLAGTLFLGAAFVEIHSSFFVYGILGASLVVAPALVLAFGMFLGAPVALGVGAVSLVATAAAALAEPLDPGLSALEAEQLVFYGFAVAATAVLIALGVRLFGAVAAASEASRARTQDLIAHAPDGILVVGTPGRVLEANPAAARMLGRNEDAVVGAFMEDLGLAHVPGRTLTGPIALAAHGGPRYVEATSRQLPESAPPARIQVMLRDVTARVEAEARERARVEHLHHTQRLAVVGTLAGGIAHDFNNLLTVIRGSAELIRLEGGVAFEGLANDILEAEARGSALIRQLLLFARAGEDERRPVVVAAEVGRLEPLVRGLLGERFALELRLSARGRVLADPTHVERILASLVDNACEASGESAEVRIEVADEVHEGDPHVRMTVADRGEGMSEDVRARMFDPFFTTREQGHVGLGLSAVQALVQEAGGRIRVDSAPGEGTAVHVLWPAVRDDDAELEDGYGAALGGMPDAGR